MKSILSHISLLNTWILIVPFWLGGMLLSMLHGKKVKRAADMSWYTTRDTIFSWGSMLLLFVFILASLFIPLQCNSVWFLAGLPLIVIGMTGHILAKRAFFMAKEGSPVSGGIYRYSRNPMYTFMSLALCGSAVSARSILLACIWFAMALCMHMLILGEERFCKNRYGESYVGYMQQTPRYFLFF